MGEPENYVKCEHCGATWPWPSDKLKKYPCPRCGKPVERKTSGDPDEADKEASTPAKEADETGSEDKAAVKAAEEEEDAAGVFQKESEEEPSEGDKSDADDGPVFRELSLDLAETSSWLVDGAEAIDQLPTEVPTLPPHLPDGGKIHGDVTKAPTESEAGLLPPLEELDSSAIASAEEVLASMEEEIEPEEEHTDPRHALMLALLTIVVVGGIGLTARLVIWTVAAWEEAHSTGQIVRLREKELQQISSVVEAKDATADSLRKQARMALEAAQTASEEARGLRLDLQVARRRLTENAAKLGKLEDESKFLKRRLSDTRTSFEAEKKKLQSERESLQAELELLKAEQEELWGMLAAARTSAASPGTSGSRDPASVRRYVAAVEALYAGNNPQAAADMLNRIIEGGHAFTEVHLVSADALMRLHRYKEAGAALRAAAKMSSKGDMKALAFYRLGRLSRSRLNDPGGTVAAFDEAAAQHAGPYSDLAQVNILLHSQKVDEAAALASRVAGKHPALWEARLLEAESLGLLASPDYLAAGAAASSEKEKSSAEKALALYSETLQLNPACLDAVIGKARVLTVLGRLEEAEKEYRNVLRRDSSMMDAVVGIAETSLLKGNERAALALLGRLLASAPENVAALRLRGRALASSNAQAAEADLSKAIALDPTDARTFLTRGRLKAEKGRHAEASDDLAKASGLLPGSKAVRLEWAEELIRAKKEARAVEVLTAFLDKAPADTRICLALVRLLSSADDAEVRDPKRAVSLAAEAVRLTGEKDVEALTALAAALFQVGRPGKAADAQRKAVTLDEKNEELWKLLKKYEDSAAKKGPPPPAVAPPPPDAEKEE